METKILFVLSLLLLLLSHRSNILLNHNKIISYFQIINNLKTKSSNKLNKLNIMNMKKTNNNPNNNPNNNLSKNPNNNLSKNPNNNLSNNPNNNLLIKINNYLSNINILSKIKTYTNTIHTSKLTQEEPPSPEEILQSLENLLKQIPLVPNNLPQILKHLIEEVEKTSLKGKKKANLALYTLKKTMTNLPENDNSMVLLILLDNGTIENMINEICDASKGKYKINTLSIKHPPSPQSTKPSSLTKLGCIPMPI